MSEAQPSPPPPAAMLVRLVRAAAGWECQVHVKDPRGTANLAVLVTDDELRRYGKGRSPEQLVRASVEFLLQREPPSSILPRFSLAEIERYFAEYAELV